MGKYKYTLDKDHYFYIKELEFTYFKDEYFECIYGNCVLKKGYSWNGCSFVKDYDETYYPSAEHDALYQYGRKLKLKRKYADKQFYKSMELYKFVKSEKYYKGVRYFGWLFYW